MPSLRPIGDIQQPPANTEVPSQTSASDDCFEIHHLASFLLHCTILPIVFKLSSLYRNSNY